MGFWLALLVGRRQVGLDSAHHCLEPGEMQTHGIPNDAGSDVVVLVAKDIADSGNIGPRDVEDTCP